MVLVGRTPNFSKHLAEFATGNFILLMTIQKGGVGLNLTCCSKIIILEPQWNPQVCSNTLFWLPFHLLTFRKIEIQAEGRCHRFGQKEEVLAYRLVQYNSAEEKVISQQCQKLLFAADVTGDTKLLTEQTKVRMSLEDLYNRKFFMYVISSTSF